MENKMTAELYDSLKFDVEVGVSYDTSNNCGIRFIVYGKGSSWTKAFADAKRSGR